MVIATAKRKRGVLNKNKWVSPGVCWGLFNLVMCGSVGVPNFKWRNYKQLEIHQNDLEESDKCP